MHQTKAYMDRRLISGFQIFNKLVLLSGLTAIIVLPIIKDGWDNYNPIWALECTPVIILWAVIGYFMAWGEHPVYFDDKAIYWRRRGVEQIIPLTSLKEISVSDMKGTCAINLKYINEEKDIKSLHFLLPGLTDSGPSKRELVSELQRMIHIKRPGLEISIPSWSALA